MLSRVQDGGEVSYTGIIYDVDDDHQGNTLWGVQWSNGDKSDFDINEMRKYCVLQQHGQPSSGDWINSFCSDITAVKARLDKLKVNYYLTKDKGVLGAGGEIMPLQGFMTKPPW